MADRVYVRNLFIAALACLQPGIEPVFLNLLTANAALPAAEHGWVAGAGQLGMAAGALLCWSIPATSGCSMALGAAAMTIVANMVMADAFQLDWIIAARTIIGFGSGFVFTRATGAATRANANHAFGMILLIQLLLATAVSAGLPLIAAGATPSFAIGIMALCPAVLFFLLLSERSQEEEAAHAPVEEGMLGRDRPLVVSIAAIVAMFLVIATTMMIWSYAGALGTDIGLDDRDIGMTVAIGSLSGVLPALAASRMKATAVPALTGLMCALAMLSLLAVPGMGMGMGSGGFIGAMCLFNVGSTFAIIRLSALAVVSQAPAPLRRCVAALHCTAMVIGPIAGGMAVKSAGIQGLNLVATIALGSAVAALTIANSGSRRPARSAGRDANVLRSGSHFPAAEIALD